MYPTLIEFLQVGHQWFKVAQHGLASQLSTCCFQEQLSPIGCCAWVHQGMNEFTYLLVPIVIGRSWILVEQLPGYVVMKLEQ